jgi:exodeoxyribonuclease VII large subunit
VHRAGSGHVYFSLADEGGQLRAALFRSAARRLAFEPEDGLEALVYGELTVYESRGDLQIIVRHLEPRGRGALQLAFEQLRRRLEAEGLFDPARKRPLPPLPTCVGVVTSPTGAAIRDVLQVAQRRFPAAAILLAPARVQGAGAADEIAAALDALGARPEVSLILLVRGGGSLEDLQAFNTETIARAVVRSPAPVVCGVGHEVDVTIADLVADVRAPTPSAAAEIALPEAEALRGDLARDWRRLRRAAEALLERLSARFEHEREALQTLAPSARLAAQRTRLAAAARALERAAEASLSHARSRLGEASARLDSLSPLAVLSRGYAIVRRARDGAIVRVARQVERGAGISIRVAEAEIDARVEAARALGER